MVTVLMKMIVKEVHQIRLLKFRNQETDLTISVLMKIILDKEKGVCSILIILL